ncbi:MAG: D-glycero-beta-D-manno-heptose 1-phosphate adenylyltransferase [Candidatus Omnitrophota bacterium]
MFLRKVKTLNQLKKISSSLQKKGRRIVFTNGCFDLLHFGHIKYLEDAKKMGDVLIVGVNSDASIRRLKGKSRPVISERDRAYTLAALESVDYAVIFNEDTPIRIIESLKPDILVKGADWKKGNIVGEEFVLRNKGAVKRINLVKGRSTTNIIEKIAQLQRI